MEEGRVDSGKKKEKEKKKSIRLPSSLADIHNRSVIPQPPSLQCHIRRFRFKSILKSCSSISPATGGLVLLQCSPHKWQTGKGGNWKTRMSKDRRNDKSSTRREGGTEQMIKIGALGGQKEEDCLYGRALGCTGLCWSGGDTQEGDRVPDRHTESRTVWKVSGRV